VNIAWELRAKMRQAKVTRRTITAKVFRMPDGTEAVFEITGDANSQAVACIALTNRGTAVLAEQFRPGPERLMMELPGGGASSGEPLEDAASRELIEETGYVPDSIYYLGDMCYDAYANGTRSYFLAVGCERRKPQELDRNEYIVVHEVDVDVLVELAMKGQMTDPGGVLLALPFLMNYPGVRKLFTPRDLP
jgi:ADP-ribose diphosphatase